MGACYDWIGLLKRSAPIKESFRGVAACQIFLPYLLGFLFQDLEMSSLLFLNNTTGSCKGSHRVILVFNPAKDQDYLRDIGLNI